MTVLGWIDKRLRKFLYLNKNRFIDKPRPTGIEYVHTTAECKDIKLLLGRMGFYDNWMFSYYAQGEIENMALSYYNPEMEVEWVQYHVRMWRGEENTEIECHFEPHALLQTDEHIEKELFDRERGLELLTEVLRDEEVNYTIVKH